MSLPLYVNLEDPEIVWVLKHYPDAEVVFHPGNATELGGGVSIYHREGRTVYPMTVEDRAAMEAEQGPVVQSTAETLRRVVQARLGGKVQRAHGIPHQGSYSNAEHQWGVLMLMHYLWPADFPRLALHCASHDNPEAWAGDIPAPTMRYLPGLKAQLAPIEDGLNEAIGLPGENKLSPEDLAKLKACDRLELYIWCREQLHMGNEYARECMLELDRYFTETPLPGPAAALHKQIQRSDLLPRQAGVMKEVCEAL